jgi:hypothetical protein
MVPICPRPFQTCFQLLPASDDLKMPVPNATLPRMLASPEPAYTTFGSESATAIEPIEFVGWSSKIGFQVLPPFSLFHTPACENAA